MRKTTEGAGGFTLVELLFAILISSLVIIALYSAQRAQQRTHGSQELVADLQQSIRAAMSVMANDIHIAGYKPAGDGAGDIVDLNAEYLRHTKFEITAAEQGKFAFIRYVKTLNDDAERSLKGEEAQEITYKIALKYDENGDGVVDKNLDEAALGREAITCTADNDWCKNIPVGSYTPDPVTRDLQAVEFVYLMCPKDRDGLRYFSGKVSLNPPKDQYEDICAVTVSLLLRSPVEDPTMPGGLPMPQPASQTLWKGKGLQNEHWPALDPNDASEYRHRRRLYYTTIQLRNSHLIKL